MVEITDTARDKLREIIEGDGKKYLRLYIEGLGWGGPRLGLALDEPEENEESYSVNGIDVLIAEHVMPHVEGTTLDYIEQYGSAGFILKGQASTC